MGALPGGGALDDEEVLTRADVADAACGSGELVEARGALEAGRDAGALGPERRHLGAALVELVARLAGTSVIGRT